MNPPIVHVAAAPDAAGNHVCSVCGDLIREAKDWRGPLETGIRYSMQLRTDRWGDPMVLDFWIPDGWELDEGSILCRKS